MAQKYIPSLSEVAGQIAGSMRFIDTEIDRIQEEVTRTKNVSHETINDVLNLLRVVADSNTKTADAIATYDNYLRKKHGMDTSMIIAIEE